MLRKMEPSAKTYDDYLQDSSLTPITTSHSIFNGFMQGVGTNILAAQQVGTYFSGVPLIDENLVTSMQAIEQENQSPQQGIGQVTANVVSNMIGSGLGTGYLGQLAGRGTALAIGAVGRKAVPIGFDNFTKKSLESVFGENVAPYLPKAAMEEGKRTLNLGEYGTRLASSYGAGAGFVLPQAIVENYNANENTLHWGGVAKETLGYGGAVGLGIDVFPYTAGVIWGKTKGLLGEELEKMPMPGTLKGALPENFSGEESGAGHHPTLDKLWKAHEDGRISLSEYQWMRDYLVNPSNLENMRQRGVSILMKDGHPVDPAQLQVMLQLMKPEDAQSYLSGIADQLGSAVDRQADSSLSEYVVNNGLDRLQSDPKLIDGLQGFHQFISHKLDKKPEHLGSLERQRESGNFEHINNTHPFSQKMIYTAEKNGAKRVPHTVPENVSRRIKQEERIKHLEAKRERALGKGVPEELVIAKNDIDKQISKVDKERSNLQVKLDSSIDRIARHEDKIKEIEEKIKSETKEKKISQLKEQLDSAKEKQKLLADDNKKLNQSLKFAETNRRNVLNKLKHIETKMREHAAKQKAQGKSAVDVDRIKRMEEKLDKLRKTLPNILHPDDELREIEKTLLGKSELPKNFRSTKEYQRLHDLSQISDRAKMLLHHVELVREYEKQEGFKNIADMLIQMSEKGFRQLADGDRVVSYLKNRVEQAADLKPKVEEAPRPIEEPVPQDAETILKQQEQEQKTPSEEHKEAYDQSKARFDEFKNKENVFKNFIQCVMGSTNG